MMRSNGDWRTGYAKPRPSSPRRYRPPAAIAANAPLSIRQAKKSIHHGLDMDLKSALLYEIEAYNRLVVTEDRLEGVRAFNEKRKPAFKGR